MGVCNLKVLSSSGYTIASVVYVCKNEYAVKIRVFKKGCSIDTKSSKLLCLNESSTDVLSVLYILYNSPITRYCSSYKDKYL